jgi:hypothetical protein
VDENLRKRVNAALGRVSNGAFRNSIAAELTRLDRQAKGQGQAASRSADVDVVPLKKCCCLWSKSLERVVLYCVAHSLTGSQADPDSKGAQVDKLIAVQTIEMSMYITGIEENNWNKDRATVTLKEDRVDPSSDARSIRFDSPDDLVDGLRYGKLYRVTITEEEV